MLLVAIRARTRAIGILSFAAGAFVACGGSKPEPAIGSSHDERPTSAVPIPEISKSEGKDASKPPEPDEESEPEGAPVKAVTPEESAGFKTRCDDLRKAASEAMRKSENPDAYPDGVLPSLPHRTAVMRRTLLKDPPKMPDKDRAFCVDVFDRAMQTSIDRALDAEAKLVLGKFAEGLKARFAKRRHLCSSPAGPTPPRPKKKRAVSPASEEPRIDTATWQRGGWRCVVGSATSPTSKFARAKLASTSLQLSYEGDRKSGSFVLKAVARPPTASRRLVWMLEGHAKGRKLELGDVAGP